MRISLRVATLALLAAPGLGFTDCAEFAQVPIPATDRVPPTVCTKVVRPYSTEPPIEGCPAVTGIFDATPASPVVIAVIARDAGGVRAMGHNTWIRCDNSLAFEQEPPCLYLDEAPLGPNGDKDGQSKDGQVPALGAWFGHCGIIEDEQFGSVGSLVSNGMWTGYEIKAGPCGGRGYRFGGEVGVTDFFNNRVLVQLPVVRFTP